MIVLLRTTNESIVISGEADGERVEATVCVNAIHFSSRAVDLRIAGTGRLEISVGCETIDSKNIATIGGNKVAVVNLSQGFGKAIMLNQLVEIVLVMVRNGQVRLGFSGPAAIKSECAEIAS